MTQEEFQAVYRAALAADDVYSVAVTTAGYKSRWDVKRPDMLENETLYAAYSAKRAADDALHDAFEQMRLAARDDVASQAAIGFTV